MKRVILFIVLIGLVLSACKYGRMEPKASFWVKGSKVKNEQQFFVNTSEFATRYYWYIDGEFVSNEEDLGWVFNKAGHHYIALTAELGKDGKTDTKEIRILIGDWRE